MAINTTLNLQAIVRYALNEMADQDLIKHEDYLMLSDLLEKAMHKHYKAKTLDTEDPTTEGFL